MNVLIINETKKAKSRKNFPLCSDVNNFEESSKAADHKNVAFAAKADKGHDNESVKTIPVAPPLPPPGFLAQETPKTTVSSEKPKVSQAEKALLKQLEGINDPTFVGFLTNQLKVKNRSRDRSETEQEM